MLRAILRNHKEQWEFLMALTRTICNVLGVLISIIYLYWVMHR